MSKKIILIIIISCLCSYSLFSKSNIIKLPLSQQIKKFELGIRYLKLGNTYRTAQDFENAKSYLKKGSEIIDNFGNQYWLATSNEYYGYLYSDMGDTKTALNYFQKAMDIYDKIIIQKDGSKKALKKVISKLKNEKSAKSNVENNNELKKSQDEIEKLRKQNIALQEQLKILKNEIDSLKESVSVTKGRAAVQKEKKPEIVKNPAKIQYPTEQEILDELNLFRSNPAKYADFIEATIPDFRGYLYTKPGEMAIKTVEGKSAVLEAIKILRKTAPLGNYVLSKEISKASMDHVKDTGPKGIIGHNGTDGSDVPKRISRYGKWMQSCGEVITYGRNNARDMIISFLVDDGVPDRGHRINLLNPRFKKVGIAVGPHKVYQTMLVIDLVEDIILTKS